MSGTFGLKEDTWHNRFPLDRLVENVPTISSYCMPPGGYPAGLSPTRESSEPIRMMRFKCPDCSRACHRLHFTDGQWRCRLCGKLDYASRHIGRTVPGLRRARTLHKRLSTRRIRRSHKKQLAILRELADLEEGLRIYLKHDINNVLERREKADARRRSRVDRPGS